MKKHRARRTPPGRRALAAQTALRNIASAEMTCGSIRAAIATTEAAIARDREAGVDPATLDAVEDQLAGFRITLEQGVFHLAAARTAAGFAPLGSL